MIELKKNIFRPVKTAINTQPFGYNNACINSHRQVKTKVSGFCPAGYSDLYLSFGLKGHNGEDWGLWRGEPIYFPVSDMGISWKAKTEVDMDGGIGVDVISDKEVLVRDYKQLGLVKNHPDGYYGYIKFRFWHLQKVNVYDGQAIQFGDMLGWGDSTGLSSGDHLHFSMKMCDQLGRGLNTFNGYAGCIDYRQFFDDIFCLDFLKIKQQLTLAQLTVKLMFILFGI